MRKVQAVIVAVIVGIGIASVANASRNTAGVYSLPGGNPVTSGTTISATWANNTLSDIAAALSDSASRSGHGGFTAAVRGPDGSAATPTFSWSSDTGTGLYLVGPHDVGLSINGTRTHEWQASGETVTGTLAVSGAATLSSTLAVTGASTLTGGVVVGNGTITTNTAATKLYLKGNLAADSTDADVVVDTPVQRTAGNLLSLRNLGGEKVIVDYSGRVTVAAPTDSAHAATKGYVDGLSVVKSASIASDASVVAQKGSPTISSISHVAASGTYAITLAGVTTNSIALVSLMNGSTSGTISATLALDTLTVTTRTTGGALSDMPFTFLVTQF